jgi:hypothetical protein
MSAVDLLRELRNRGVELEPIGDDRIRWRAPRGALLPGDLEQLRTHRLALIEVLRASQHPLAEVVDLDLARARRAARARGRVPEALQ